MNKALIDTDLFSEILKGRDPQVQRNAARYRRMFGPLTLSVVTAMEVVKGLRKVGRESSIRALLSGLASEEVLAFDLDAAERAGRIHADLERAGQQIGWADTVIASIALSRGLELVTGNIAHYRRVQERGYPLILVNWRHQPDDDQGRWSQND